MGDDAQADEGLFLATLQGKGTVWLQSLPFSRMADRILLAAHKWAAMTRARVQCRAVWKAAGWRQPLALIIASSGGAAACLVENLIRIKHALSRASKDFFIAAAIAQKSLQQTNAMLGGNAAPTRLHQFEYLRTHGVANVKKFLNRK